MKTLKDILEVPLGDLSKGVVQWVEHSFRFWGEWLNNYNVSAAMEAGNENIEDETKEEPEKKEIATDLKAVIEYNKAIVEKYQATGSESLFKHLVIQFSKERDVKLDTIMNNGETAEEVLIKELKAAIDVSVEEQKILKIEPSERVEYVVKKVLEKNPDVIEKVRNGDKEIVKELDEEAAKIACGIVKGSDLKYALRSMIMVELNKGNIDDD